MTTWFEHVPNNCSILSHPSVASSPLRHVVGHRLQSAVGGHVTSDRLRLTMADLRSQLHR